MGCIDLKNDLSSCAEVVERYKVRPSEAYVKEGDYMVITGNNNDHEFEIGEIVKVLSPFSGDVDFCAELAVNPDEYSVYFVEYADARFATADEIAAATTTCVTVNINPPLHIKLDAFFEGMGTLLVAKNENYGDSFSKQYDKYGMQCVEMRLNDKFMRLEQLIGGDTDKVGESIDDTLTDIIGYCTLALLKRKENGGYN